MGLRLYRDDAKQITLRDYFVAVFEPWASAQRGRVLDWKTAESYCETIGWWEHLTKDCPLDRIDQLMVDQFQARLREAISQLPVPGGV